MVESFLVFDKITDLLSKYCSEFNKFSTIIKLKVKRILQVDYEFIILKDYGRVQNFAENRELNCFAERRKQRVMGPERAFNLWSKNLFIQHQCSEQQVNRFNCEYAKIA
jgi:hypothetical protein